MSKNIILFFLLMIPLQSNLFAQKKDIGFLKAQELLGNSQYYESLYEFKSVKTYDDFEENFKNKHIAFIYSKLNNYEQALLFLVKKNDDNQNFLLGVAHFENDSIYSAIEFLKEAILKNTKNVQAYNYLGKAYFKKKDYRNTLINIEKAKELGYEEVLVEKTLGMLLF